MIRETNSTTGDITDYLYGDDLIKQTKAANDSYYLYDGLGSARALTNSAGTITDTYNYESFGTVLNQTGATPNNYLFTGEQFDNALGMTYLRNRYYDSSIGRFNQMDTWMGNNSDPVTLHKYLYANADPVNNIDPSGNISLGSVMSAVNVMSTLVGTATTSYDIGSSLYGHYTGDEPIELSMASAQQVGFALMMSVSGGKILNKIFGKTKYKKLLKEHTLLRGVNSSNVGYSDAIKGYVGGNYSDFLRPSTYSSNTASQHNAGDTIGSQFSSWTKKISVARHFATWSTSDYKRSHGVIIRAKVKAFRIFKSPNLKLLNVGGKAVSEGEFLVVGPVQGIPRMVK